MNILALDTATRTGWAVHAAGVTTSGVIDCSIRTKATAHIEADHSGKRFWMFRKQLHDLILTNYIDLIVYEKVVGGRNAGGNTSMIQKGLEALVWMEAFAPSCPVPVWSFAAGTIKKWATGSGLLTHESKAEMVRLAFMKFDDQEWVQTSKGVDDNQADALWILDLTLAVMGIVKVSDFGPSEPDTLESLTRYANHVTAAKWSPAKKR